MITTLVDNVYDALLAGDERTTRAPFSAGRAQAPQFETGSTMVGLMAEHGFSALVSVRRGATTTTLLFDTGLSPDAMVTNADRLGADLSQIQAVVLSHGHFDHAGGLAGLAGRRGTRSLPMVVHPKIWTRRRLAVPGREPEELPTLSRRALDAEGFTVIERREPSLLADDCVLITGEIDRTTEFEHGMPPPHQEWTGSAWQHDPLVLDDQALIVHVRGRGLVVLTGCGHAGAINIVRHAQRLTAVPALHALLGGLHLSGPAFEPIIGRTVAPYRHDPRARSARTLHRLARPACPRGGPARGPGPPAAAAHRSGSPPPDPQRSPWPVVDRRRTPGWPRSFMPGWRVR